MRRRSLLPLALILTLLPACSKTPEEKLCARLLELMEKEGTPIPSGGSVSACARGLVELSQSKPAVWSCARPCMEAAQTASAHISCVPDCGKAEKKEAKTTRPERKPEPFASLSNPKVNADAKHAFWTRGILGDKNIAHNGDFTVDLEIFSPHAGNTVEVGSQKVTIAERGRAVIKLDLKPLLFAALKKTEAKPDSIFSPPSHTLPVKITTRDGSSRTGELLVATMDLLAQWFEQTAAEGKPMLIEGEKPGTNAFRSLLHKDGRFCHLLGNAGSWEEIDLVAFTRFQDRRTQRCGTYRGAKTGKTVVLEITLSDQLAEIHDRRTGKLVRKQLFRATGTCPKSTTSTATQSFFVSTVAVAAWYAKQLKK